jgi:hypothetical protein
MKKLLFITIISVLALALSACGNSNLKANTIAEAKLTEREKGILSTTSNQSFVFDYNIESEYKKVTIWIEKYEFGKLVDEPIGGMTTEVKDKGSIIFTAFKSNDTQNQTLFNVGLHSNGDTGSYNTSDIISSNGTDGMFISWGNISEVIEITNGEVVLASICYSRGSTMASRTSEFYRDVEGRIHEIKDYDVVYLLKSKFSN